jgi:glutathione S-transferase
VIELWHEWNSVHSFKVRITLAEKGLAWVDHPVQLLRFEQLAPAYLAINPDGVVPTLVHDGVKLYDSSPICEYLEEIAPTPPLMPREPAARLAVRRWLKYHDDVAHPAVRDASFQLLFKPYYAAMPRAELEAAVARHPRPERRQKFLDAGRTPFDRAALAHSIAACEGIIARLDAALGGRAWLVGDAFTLAEVAMAPFVERLENLALEQLWRERPVLADWVERVLARASVQVSRAPAAYRLPRPEMTETHSRLG